MYLPWKRRSTHPSTAASEVAHLDNQPVDQDRRSEAPPDRHVERVGDGAAQVHLSPSNDEELRRINAITSRVIGCAIEAHRTLGCGLLESVYRSALSIQFESDGVTYQREVRVPAIYKGHQLGEYRLA